MMTKLIDTSRPRYKSTFMGRIYIAVRHGRVLSALKKRIKPRLIRIGRVVMKVPSFKRFFDWALSQTPSLQLRVNRILWNESQLSNRALSIYGNLKISVELNLKNKKHANSD